MKNVLYSGKNRGHVPQYTARNIDLHIKSITYQNCVIYHMELFNILDGNNHFNGKCEINKYVGGPNILQGRSKQYGHYGMGRTVFTTQNDFFS